MVGAKSVLGGGVDPCSCCAPGFLRRGERETGQGRGRMNWVENEFGVDRKCIGPGVAENFKKKAWEERWAGGRLKGKGKEWAGRANGMGIKVGC